MGLEPHRPSLPERRKEASKLAAGYVIEERKHFPNTLGRVRRLATIDLATKGD